MKRRLSLLLSALLLVILPACGPAATPTLTVEQIIGTANADAFAALTQTQAAMPTATETPIPPTPTLTFTPAPTFTPFPTVVPPTLPSAATANPCNEPPPVEPLGTVVKIKLINKSEGDVSPLSLGMMQENDKHECGTYTFSLGQFDEQVVSVLAGCYWGYGFINGSKPSTPETASPLCVTDTTKETAIWITADLIAFH
jgi:hypothetical protein